MRRYKGQGAAPTPQKFGCLGQGVLKRELSLHFLPIIPAYIVSPLLPVYFTRRQCTVYTRRCCMFIAVSEQRTMSMIDS